MGLGTCSSRTHFVITLLAMSIAAVMTPPASSQAASVVKLLSTPNPVVQGQPVTFTAGVNWTLNATPSGTITVNDTCPGAGATTALGSITLGGPNSATPGSGTLTVSSFPCLGGNSIVASYGGDANYSAGASQPLIENVLAQFTPTSLGVGSSPNPSTAEQTVVFSAKLGYSLPATSYPTGTVTFTDTQTGNVLGSSPVQTSGTGSEVVTGASLTVASLAAGSYAVRASYSGNSMYGPSASPIVNQLVTSGGPVTPTITSIVTVQGARASNTSNIAQNTWIEIHGTNLSQSTQDWSNQDFSKGLPMSLGSVSATVNNQPAAISYISPTQVNILTPLDNSTGPVPVQLKTPLGSTGSMPAMMLQSSPTFLVVDGAGHVAARHVDYSLAGPASLSSPGYLFAPVKPGEIVLLYSVGSGQTSPAITDQLRGSGSLPALPGVTIGGLPATVLAAGISGPGLYQFNVVVPANAPDGDLPLSATYNGMSTESGVTLTVQH